MIIYGASGHGKVIADILKKNGISEIVFWDDDIKAVVNGYVVEKPFLFQKSNKIIIAVGNNFVRKEIADTNNFFYGKAIHPNSTIGENVSIQEGTVVMAGAIINSSTRIGKHCILNTSCSIDHDCQIEDYVHVSPNSTLLGGVRVGEGCWIGAGATIIQGISIGKWAIVGAGAVIIRDVPDGVTVVGNPGRIKNIK
uniref:acetyltransferase n=1 Tax=Flavobacterium sp. TaxID=239 RepID=UPI004049C102